MKDRLLYDLFKAYYEARKNKRNTLSQLEFELDFETSLFHLHENLLSGKYTISRSICFIISDPIKREIFASGFRDRVVHHLIYNYIYRYFDRHFIHDSYSCRIGKGTHYGIKRIDYFIRSCTKNYTSDCYILKLDIKGFFMSINKEKLKALLTKSITSDGFAKENPQVEVSRLLSLIYQVIDHDPTTDFLFK